ncbi:MAG: nickel-dependent lactate racemase [Candidatus Heteroscillospira sp.]
MSVKVKYGHSDLTVETVNDNYEVLISRIDELQPGMTGAELVKKAMENPIASPRLCELAKGKKNAVVIISDHTRPVPSKDILPFMLAELREGSPDIDITLLVATGCHRLTETQELRAKLGDEIFENEKIIVHDCRANNVKIGTLPSGAELVIDRVAQEAELVVAEGFIEPHFFAGFSGGRKSILPGVCDKQTVMGNHCSAFLADPMSRSGVLDGNPIHRDMIAAARMAGLAYIVNVILDGSHKTVAAFAGDAIQAHRAGCDELMRWCGVKPERRGDIVISTNGGAPLDQNLYQAVKGIVTAEGVAAENGVIIMCSECADGSGSDDFYTAMRDCPSAQAMLDHVLSVAQNDTPVDQWQYQMLVRVLVKHRVIMVTRPELAQMVADLKMEYAPSLEKALEMAYADRGEDAHLVVLPDGIAVVPED